LANKIIIFNLNPINWELNITILSNMEDKTAYYATLAYSSELAPDLKELCQKHNMKQKEFLENSIRFFRRTGINPADETLDLQSQITRTETRLIGFIKTQDKMAQEHFQILNRKLSENKGNADIWEAMTTLNENMQQLVAINTQLLSSK
jgi:hypothetical protein